MTKLTPEQWQEVVTKGRPSHSIIREILRIVFMVAITLFTMLGFIGTIAAILYR